MGTATTKTETGLTCNTVYTRYVWAYNSSGNSVATALTQTTSSCGSNFPTVTTTSVTNITQTTATTGGNVISDGGTSVTERGVCWSTSANPSITTNHTHNGSGTGTFVSNLAGLTANTFYYVRAYATNSVGTSYGEQLTFTSAPTLPTVTTNDISNIAQTTATSGGNVTYDGGAPITARGVCWRTSPTPTIADSKTIDGSGTGSFISSLTGLAQGTVFYVRAYATNSVGTAYGSEKSFTTTTYYIGLNYGGGIIFYIDGTGIHGLISSTSDQSSAEWGCNGISISGTSPSIGTGNANTNAIVSGCSVGGIAAHICFDLSLNGYTDWFLPSLDELNQMYLQKTVIGGFTTTGIIWEAGYWSSTQYATTNAKAINFADGLEAIVQKNGILKVRAIRAF